MFLVTNSFKSTDGSYKVVTTSGPYADRLSAKLDISSRYGRAAGKLDIVSIFEEVN